MRVVNLKKQSGVSLIEILVTIFILSIGLLGLAGLQIGSISGNQEGFFGSQATSIAEDISSRIRSAKIVTMIPDDDKRINHLEYISKYVSNVVLACDVAIAKKCIGDVDCTFDEIAAYDKWDICTVAKNTLPNGQVWVVNNNAGAVGKRLTIAVDWDPASERSDLGNKKNINSECEAITGKDDKNCIILEILP